MTNFEQFKRGYISCLYFVDTGDEDEPSPDAPLSPEALEHIFETCWKFWCEFGKTILEAECRSFDVTKADRAGFDFYLTRAGHGAGFWDGDWSEPHATILTDGCEGQGDDYLYLNDDGFIDIG